ncbi:hypothetical protein Bca4012_027391 [Brassica carinata]
MLPTTSRSRSSSSSSSRANLPDLALLLLHPELTQCSFSIFVASTSGNKWILNILSGKCLTFAHLPKLSINTLSITNKRKTNGRVMTLLLL